VRLCFFEGRLSGIPGYSTAGFGIPGDKRKRVWGLSLHRRRREEEPDMFRIDKMVDARAMDTDDDFQDRSIAWQSRAASGEYTVPPGQQMVDD
jgi:hypothetical protein